MGPSFLLIVDIGHTFKNYNITPTLENRTWDHIHKIHNVARLHFL